MLKKWDVMKKAIRTKKLNKTYKGKKNQSVHALKDFSIDIPEGSIFGLLGPNGAGKSTFINILAGLVNKGKGKAYINGYDIEKETINARKSIGIVPQEINYDPFFTPRQSLKVQAGLYGLLIGDKQVLNLLSELGLEDKADSPTRGLSGGMLRRLMVAKALVHSPAIVILDEPTAGVDIELRRQLWAYIQKINSQGTTVVLTTHYLEEAEQLCDDIAIIDHGELISLEKKKNLLKLADYKEIHLVVKEEVKEVPGELKRWKTSITDAHTISIGYRPSENHFEDLLEKIKMTPFTISDLSTRETTLEDVFINLTNKKVSK